MEPKKIDKKIIYGCIAGTDGGKQNQIIAHVCSIFLFVIGIATIMIPFIFIIATAFGAFLEYKAWRNRKIIRDIVNNEYTLVVDVCSGKDVYRNTDGPDTAYLIFLEKGKVELNFPYVILTSEAVRYSPSLYADSETGDECYLLYASSGKPLFIFNSQYWYIDTTEFDYDNGIYRPKK